MPLKARYDSKTLEVYFPLPSDLKLLIVVENYFLTIALNIRNLEQTSNLLTTYTRAPKADVPNAKYLAHLAHQTQKIPPIRCYICAKIILFVSVPLQMLNQNIVFYSTFSLVSLLILIFSLSSHIKPSSSLNRERTK